MKTIAKIITAACCLVVATCALSGNGITGSIQYTDPETGAVISIESAK